MATETVPRDAVASLRNDLSYRLGTMLAAARLLADHQRVHAAVEACAKADPAFRERLGKFCPTWADPGCMEDEDAEALPELLRMACMQLGEVVKRADDVIAGGAA